MNGECPTGKVWYATSEQAEAALVEVFARRVESPSDRPPERQVYGCSFCLGFHLSSKPPELDPEPDPKGDGESWEEYAHRLERRIKAQRKTLREGNMLRADAGNRAERKRSERLQLALGRVTDLWLAEREKRIGLVGVVERLGRSR